MTVTLLLSARPETAEAWMPHLGRALAARGVDARVTSDARPEEVDFIAHAPDGPVQDFTPFTRLRAVLSLWAGVERVVNNPTLRVPLARMVDRGLTEGMVEYVTGHVLRHHLGMDRYIRAEGPSWAPVVPPLARDRRVTVLGLGALGRAVAQALAELNFRVAGWARHPREIAGIEVLAGPRGLRPALERADILVTLLPHTPETENILDAERISWLPEGAAIINPGRGALIDDNALLAALEGNRLAHATLDTFREEPLPDDHPFHCHPRITVTPHVASETRPETASAVIAENVRRALAGEELLHLVDRQRGY